MNCDNSESCAQVIVALCALGIDPAKDERFIKDGNWTVYDLISYHVDNSGFKHVKQSSSVNGIATEQGFYALVAYKRFLEGKKSLYDMSDVKIKVAKKIKVDSKKRLLSSKRKKNKEKTKKDKKINNASSNRGWEFVGEDYEADINISSKKNNVNKTMQTKTKLFLIFICVGGFLFCSIIFFAVSKVKKMIKKLSQPNY